MNSTLQDSGLFWPYIKILNFLDGNFKIELCKMINSSAQGFLTDIQIIILYLFYYSQCGKIVEVGSYKGKSTICALVALDGNEFELYCVDHFMGETEYQAENKDADMSKFEGTLDSFKNNLSKHNMLEKVNIQQGSSSDMSKLHKDNTLDIIFIDGAHDYDSVKLDINVWYPKLKDGGIMFGHDYPSPYDPNGGFEGLRDAVNENIRDSDRFDKFGFTAGFWGAHKKD